MYSDEGKAVIKDVLKANQIKILDPAEIRLEAIYSKNEDSGIRTYKAYYKENFVAVKIYTKPDIKKFVQELIAFSILESPCLPKLVGITYEEDEISVVTEYAEGQSLDKYNPLKISEDQKFSLALKLAEVLCFLHTNNIVHRNLIPSHLVWCKETEKLKILSFRQIKCFVEKDEIISRIPDSSEIYFMAPEEFDIEEINEENEKLNIVRKSFDVWAYGCIVSWLFSGYCPWINYYDDKYVQSCLCKKKEFPIPTNITNPGILKVIEMCTIISVQERSSIEEVYNTLKKLA
jgi:serine/threonine protein kinase